MNCLRLTVWLAVLALLAGFRATTCPGEENPPSPQFESDILPLLKSKCWKCHGAEVRKAELGLHTPEGIRKGSESGAILVPGKSGESRLYEVLHEGEMPPDKKDPLTKEQVELIRKWIDAGALFGKGTSTAKPEISQHDIVPILLLRCTACHGRQKQEGGLDLRNRSALLKGGKSGPAFVPGKPEQSLILKRIHSEEMPPRQRLTEVSVKPMEAGEIEKLTQWIALGAPEIADEPDVSGTAADPLVRDEDRQFWSFQRPQRAAIPVVQATDLVRNPIDAFLLRQLESKQLSFAPEADRGTLLRRAAFDLTGLPPEPEELETFLADTSPDAYERLVERLLASPRYGERWGRHWLDVAGYADCEGRREQHLPRNFAWRYRDYVIRAFNADKPFDRFLQEQIAGDELADYEHAPEITQQIEDNLVATAFLRMSPDPTWANLTGYVPDRLEVTADMLDVLGSGVMGLTFKCARCHTHKFDPIPQRDYYRLVALLKGAYDEHDWLKPELNSYGGALSAGFGERFLSAVSTEKRKQWEQHNARIQQEIDTLKAVVPQTPETMKRQNELAGQRLPEPRIMAMWDRGDPSPTYIYRRGDYQNSGALVQAGVPAVLSDPKTPFEIKPPWPGAKSTGRRLAFARWLTHPDQPLTARVMVNRIWKLHFGQGLVRSLGNFGKTGDKPTHPELLDWLALEFIREGWSIKAMQRLMLTSSVYRQSSLVSNPKQVEFDPDNRLLSRMPLRRMEAELVRDTLLLVSGQLNASAYGPADAVSVRPDGLVLSSKRRSIYIQQLRKHPVSLLESFDLPAMNPNCLQRAESLVAPQALQLLNDSAVRELANQFASRVHHEVGDDATQQIGRVFQIGLSRNPSPEEQAVGTQSLAQLTEEWTKQLTASGQASKAEASRRALSTFCHTIINSAAFLYLD
ncbi:MAG: putative rane protein [Planctomycetaceae bacterium]|nr:putative rane protein [Planctomycetaceae bacterium]